jgi:hypothetical protein
MLRVWPRELRVVRHIWIRREFLRLAAEVKDAYDRRLAFWYSLEALMGDPIGRLAFLASHTFAIAWLRRDLALNTPDGWYGPPMYINGMWRGYTVGSERGYIIGITRDACELAQYMCLPNLFIVPLREDLSRDWHPPLPHWKPPERIAKVEAIMAAGAPPPKPRSEHDATPRFGQVASICEYWPQPEPEVDLDDNDDDDVVPPLES